MAILISTEKLNEARKFLGDAAIIQLAEDMNFNLLIYSIVDFSYIYLRQRQFGS